MLVRPLVAAATLLLVVAACGTGSDEPQDADPAPSDPTSTATAPPPRPTAPEPTTAGTTITGVVGDGVETGCLTLTTTGSTRTTWLLVGQTAGVTAGDRVTVRGSPAPDLATRCQQGTPFVVETVEPG